MRGAGSDARATAPIACRVDSGGHRQAADDAPEVVGTARSRRWQRSPVDVLKELRACWHETISRRVRHGRLTPRSAEVKAWAVVDAGAVGFFRCGGLRLLFRIPAAAQS